VPGAAWALLLALAPAPIAAQVPRPAPAQRESVPSMILLTPRPGERTPGADSAQGPELVDRVVAVVGDQPILLSDIQERILLQEAGGGLQLPPDSAGRMAVRRQLLQTMIDDEVLYQKARQDTSISVSDADVLSEVNKQAQQVRDQYRSEADFRAAIAQTGFGTPEDWRRWLTEQQRRYQYQQKYLQKLRDEGKMRPATITTADLRQAFTQWQAAGGAGRKRPAMIFFKQIVIAPQPTPAARAAALAQADSILAQLRHGADFATLAKRYSDDPGTRDQGGEVGWFRRGSGVAQAFEDAAFRMRPGEISDPIRTPFGYHIIQVEKIQPGEVEARHILFTPAIDSANLAAAARRAEEVARALRAGANFDSLAHLYADTTELAVVDSVPVSQLPPLYAAAFDSAAIGEVVAPFAINTESATRTKYVVAIPTKREAERDYTFDDVRDQLRAQLAQTKPVQELIRQLRSQTYVSDRL
jgi:peptidyl-prolyl cis-trans isomerase SurA